MYHHNVCILLPSEAYLPSKVFKADIQYVFSTAFSPIILLLCEHKQKFNFFLFFIAKSLTLKINTRLLLRLYFCDPQHTDHGVTMNNHQRM